MAAPRNSGKGSSEMLWEVAGCSASLTPRGGQLGAARAAVAGRYVVGESSESWALPGAACRAAVGLAALCFCLSCGPTKLASAAGEGTPQRQDAL